jgi:lysyl-tRNA synthetase class 2
VSGDSTNPDLTAVPVDQADAEHDDVPEQVRVRTAKRAKLLETGTEPYPSGPRRTEGIGEVVAAHAGLAPDEMTGHVVTIAGRVIFNRITGKLCFVRLREGDDEIQVMLSADRAGPAALADWKAVVDIGDHILVTGEVGSSRRGELSVMADSWQITSKALRPLPVAHRPMTEEAQVRQRYVDLIVNPHARRMVHARAEVLASIRDTMRRHRFVEVETPILQSLHGGAAARPFATQLHAFDREFYLRIAMELHLKRLVVGGIERVYEIGRTFRNEGIDATHAPEFTMIEAYQAYGDCRSIAAVTRDMVVDAAVGLDRTVVPDGAGGEIDLAAEWPWVPLADVVSQVVGERVDLDSDAAKLRGIAARFDVEVPPDATTAVTLVELYEKLGEHTVLAPTFVCDYPAEVRPLARARTDDPRLADGADVVVGGVELVTLYSELADPVEQRDRLVEQSRAVGTDPEAMALDEDFLRALEHGLPPTGGMGMGIDRLLRVLTGEHSLRQIITFPLLRPE